MKRAPLSPIQITTTLLAAITAAISLTACFSEPTKIAASPTPGSTLEPTSLIRLPEVVVPGKQNPAPISPPSSPETSSAELSPTPSSPETSQPVSSVQPGDNPPPNEADQASGQVAPDFTLDSVQGEPVTLSDYRGESYVVLVFYRGQT